ncbi:MAG: response regulator [Gammaproteobacteria bacterium]
MNPLPAILIICERDPLFREALRNFLLAAGYVNVEVAATMRDALIMLCCECYGHILIDVSTPFSHGRRLAAIARKRQPEAKILCLVSAQDQPFARDASCEYVIKEYVFSNLLELM